MNSSTLISRRWLGAYFITLVFSLIVGGIYSAHFEPETKFWAETFQERREALEGNTEGPKVIFTGDSACSFGVDAQLFKDITGTMSHNLGGTRQMGMRIFMGEALRYATRGDLIVLIANPALLVSEVREKMHPKAGARMALALSENLRWTEFVDSTRPGFNHLISLGAKLALGMPGFRYKGSDRRLGGLVTTTGRDRPAPARQVFDMSSDLIAAEQTLKKWGELCQARGVHLCYLLPVELTDSEVLNENRQRKNAFLRRLKKNEIGVTILETERAGCSDDETLFADTLFHFTECGAADFTKRLASVLESVLKDL